MDIILTKIITSPHGRGRYERSELAGEGNNGYSSAYLPSFPSPRSGEAARTSPQGEVL